MAIDVETQLVRNCEPDIFGPNLETMMLAEGVNGNIKKTLLDGLMF